MNMYIKIFPKLQNTMFQPNNQLSNFKWLNRLKGIPYLNRRFLTQEVLDLSLNSKSLKTSPLNINT